jgi:hypothetical protein
VVADAMRIVPDQGRPNSARWQLGVDVAGPASLWARWPAAASHTSNAPFATEMVGTAQRGAFDQRAGGGRWQLLSQGAVAPEAMLSVRVTDRADGQVVADAMRVVDHAMFGPAGSVVIDDAQGGASPEWTWQADDSAYEGGYLSAASEESAQIAWRLPLRQPGTYRLYARWPVLENAAEAGFAIAHIDGHDVVDVDQSTGGGRWVLIGTYQLGADSTVILGGSAAGVVSIDALRLEPAHYPASDR